MNGVFMRLVWHFSAVFYKDCIAIMIFDRMMLIRAKEKTKLLWNLDTQ